MPHINRQTRQDHDRDGVFGLAFDDTVRRLFGRNTTHSQTIETDDFILAATHIRLRTIRALVCDRVLLQELI